MDYYYSIHSLGAGFGFGPMQAMGFVLNLCLIYSLSMSLSLSVSLILNLNLGMDLSLDSFYSDWVCFVWAMRSMDYVRPIDSLGARSSPGSGPMDSLGFVLNICLIYSLSMSLSLSVSLSVNLNLGMNLSLDSIYSDGVGFVWAVVSMDYIRSMDSFGARYSSGSGPMDPLHSAQVSLSFFSLCSLGLLRQPALVLASFGLAMHHSLPSWEMPQRRIASDSASDGCSSVKTLVSVGSGMFSSV